MQALFPELPRRVVENLLARYRAVHFRNGKTLVHALRWERDGAVWAMDYMKPPKPVDGQYRKILSVRDLATGQHLLALPVPEESARATADALEALFREHGAPLVIKSDNGTPLIAREVEELLLAWNVVHLRSPFRTPSFNGSCEAGVGALRTRVHFIAARNDRPGEWTCDDVEGGRLQANELGRPRGLDGATPDDAWAARRQIEPREREALRTAIAANLLAEREARGYSGAGTVLSESQVASLHRTAISRALVALGIVVFRRRYIRLPIPPIVRLGIA